MTHAFADGELVTVYVTAESEDVATHIATSLVRDGLIACANVNTGTRSVYKWDGLLQLDNEVTVFMKTSRAKMPAVIERIEKMHSYETPCITVSPIIGGAQPYLEWVAKSVEGDPVPLDDGSDPMSELD